MKLLVIGHSVVDKINFGRKIQTKPGGIFYTVATLSNLVDEKDKIFLMSEIDKSSFYLFQPTYEKVNMTLCNKVDEIPTVNLFIYDEKERDEIYSKLPKNMKIDWNFDFSIFDGILVNMVSGIDLSLEDLIKLKQTVDCPIYFDIHTFSREANSKKNRKFRPIPNIELWLKNTDIVQSNESELRTILNSESEFDIARFVHDLGPSALILTKGEKGVRLYQKKNDELISIFLPAIKVNSVNSVGCGDTFGAAYFYSYIRTNNFEKSLIYANTVAGIVTEYDEIENYTKLKNDLDKRLN